MRRIAKIDDNHKEIADAFRAHGFSVLSLAALGGGVPDMLCSRGYVSFLVEAKTEKGKVLDCQKKFLAKWGGRIFVIRSVDEAIELACRLINARISV